MSLNSPKYEAFDPARDLQCDGSFRVPSWLAACGLVAVSPERTIPAAGVPGPAHVRYSVAAKSSTGRPLRGGFARIAGAGGREILCAGNEKGELYFFELRGNTPVVCGRIALQGTILCSPLFHEGLLFCATGEGMLYAIRTTISDEGGPLRNSIEWQKKMKKGMMTSPAALPGIVLVAPMDGLYGLSVDGGPGRSPGTALWGATLGGTMSTPCVHGDTILMGTEDRRLMAFEVSSGRLTAKWECALTAACRSTPVYAAASGLVSAVTIDGTLFSAGAADGGRRWSFRPLSPSPGGAAVAAFNGGECFLLGTEKGMFYCIDARGGKAWEYDAGAGIRTEPLVHDGNVFFGAGSDRFICLDVSTGREVSVLSVEGEVSARPVVSGNIVVFGTTAGFIYAVVPG